MNTNPRADNPGPSRDCPAEDDLRNLAAGLCQPDSAAKLTRHAAECDHCGPLLRMYSEDFSDDFGAGDQAVLGKLRSSSPSWQKKLAKEMLAGSGRSANPEKKPFPWRWLLAPAAVACAAIAFAVWYSQRETPAKVEKLLAQAYTENRLVDFRFPGANYGPMRATRGYGSSMLRTQAFLEAQQIIDGQVQRKPSDEAWLQEKARAEMLNWQPESAVSSLADALGADPSSSARMIDLSMAYFELGEVSRDRANYRKALELIESVLRQDPTNHVALYNRALLHERLDRPDEAIRDWQAVLEIEKDPGWAAEARARSDAIIESKR